MTRRNKDERLVLRPPRFSLAALFVIVSLFALLFASVTYVGLFATLLLVLLASAVLAHVAGNAIGTHLRDSGNHEPRDATDRRKPLESNDFAPSSQLHHRTSLGKPIVIATISGILAGAISGGYGLALLMERPTWDIVTLGVVASATLGGIWSFVATSFIKTAASALRQASRDAK